MLSVGWAGEPRNPIQSAELLAAAWRPIPACWSAIGTESLQVDRSALVAKGRAIRPKPFE
jgi:hypothetical protein